LSSLGYQPEIFIDPREALDTFTSSPEKYDLAIIDYSMPHINGIQLTERLLKIKPGLPVVLVSGAIKGVIEEQFRKSGATTLIRKPFTRLELSQILHSIFNPD
jgi:CheY-like chemotaxis protein